MLKLFLLRHQQLQRDFRGGDHSWLESLPCRDLSRTVMAESTINATVKLFAVYQEACRPELKLQFPIKATLVDCDRLRQSILISNNSVNLPVALISSLWSLVQFCKTEDEIVVIPSVSRG